MNNIVIFGATQSGKTTLLGFLCTAMLRNPQFNEEVFQNLKLIKSLTKGDEFSIGDPSNPINVCKEVILPSFVSLDRDELRKFKDENVQGTTKRLHRKRLTICMSEQGAVENEQYENENASCIFVDMPGFRQRLSDKYRGFFEGNIGIAVLKLQEVLELNEIWNGPSSKQNDEKAEFLERRLFEPIRIWCDYRSPTHLVIALSQIDRSLSSKRNLEDSIKQQIDAISAAIDCIHLYTERFDRGFDIPICPISIKLESESNTKPNPKMSVFFHRKQENIYAKIKPELPKLPGSGTFISCLKSVLSSVAEPSRIFSMAIVYRPMKAIVENSPKTALNILALHGTIRKTETVVLGPIIDKKSGEVVYAKCNILSIKADGSENTSESLLEGNVGGLIFKSIIRLDSNCHYILDSSPKKSEIKLLKSSILSTGKVLKGDLIELEIYKSDYYTTNGNIDEIYNKILPSVMPFDSNFIFWYGKKIAINISEIDFQDEKIRLSVIVSKSEYTAVRHFALPCDENGKILNQDNVLLAIPESHYSFKSRQAKRIIGLENETPEQYTYISVNVVGLKNSEEFHTVEFMANRSMDFKTKLDGVHVEAKNIGDEIDTFYVPLKSNRKQIDIYSVLTKIGKNVRKSYSRLSYRTQGGVMMKLLK